MAVARSTYVQTVFIDNTFQMRVKSYWSRIKSTLHGSIFICSMFGALEFLINDCQQIIEILHWALKVAVELLENYLSTIF